MQKKRGFERMGAKTVKNVILLENMTPSLSIKYVNHLPQFTSPICLECGICCTIFLYKTIKEI